MMYNTSGAWVYVHSSICIIIEEMERQFVIPIERYDGMKVNMEIRQKNTNCKKRKVKTWTVEEDTQLIQLYERYPKKWASIANMMVDRNENQCLHRYRRLSQLGAHRKIWSSEEDEAVRRLMKKVGKNWKLLSEMLGSKTGKQIRERFINKLDPKIKKEDWTDEEDRKIIELYSQIGRKWSQISKNLPGRPQNKIKNRFYSYIQKNYDIKYRTIQKEEPVQVTLKEITQKVANEEPRISLQEIKTMEKYDNYGFPSINQIDLDLKMEDYENQENIPLSKIYLRSILKIEDDWYNAMRYRNMDDFTGQPDEPQHDLFYLYNN